MLKARHEDKADLNDQAVIDAAGTAAGIDMARFREDIADPSLLEELAESHTKAVDEYGAFGVPTFVFDSGNFAFLKMFIPPDEQAVEIYDNLMKSMSEYRPRWRVQAPAAAVASWGHLRPRTATTLTRHRCWGSGSGTPAFSVAPLVHRSYCNECGWDATESYERLEFLGDAVLELIVSSHLYRHSANADEGEMTKARSWLVRGETLAQVARRWQLGGSVAGGPGRRRQWRT